LAVNINL